MSDTKDPADQLGAIAEDLTRRWNDADALRARLAELDPIASGQSVELTPEQAKEHLERDPEGFHRACDEGRIRLSA